MQLIKFNECKQSLSYNELLYKLSSGASLQISISLYLKFGRCTGSRLKVKHCITDTGNYHKVLRKSFPK